MPRKYLYLALFVVGAIVPYLSFVPWVMDHGFDISLMVEELFANRISAFFGLGGELSHSLCRRMRQRGHPGVIEEIPPAKNREGIDVSDVFVEFVHVCATARMNIIPGKPCFERMRLF